MTLLRLFVSSVALLAALVAGQLAAQTQPNLPRIVHVYHGTEAQARESAALAALRTGLRERGWVDGRTIVIDIRYTEGHLDRFPGLIADAINQGADVIILGSYPSILAAKQATTKIPIVGSSCGLELLVDSLARPGANVTGVTCQSRELVAKQYQLFRDALPSLKRMGVLYNPDSPYALPVLRELRSVASSHGTLLIEAGASAPAHFALAIDKFRQAGAEGVFVTPDAMLFYNREALARLMIANRLPMMGFFADFTDAGGLMSYSANLPAQFHRLASYVDRILKGAKPGELPVEQPTNFEFVVNLKTARTLGITIPQSVLFRADRQIE